MVDKVSIEKKCKQLVTMIEEGQRVIGENNKDKAIVILGDSGVGKTTFSAFLGGIELDMIKIKGKKAFQLRYPKKYPNIVISSLKEAQTKIPSKLETESKIIIFDMPGFFDTSRIQEFANAFYIQRVLETIGEVKFLVVMPDSYVSERGGQFTRSVDHFCKMFKDPQILKDCVSLVVSKVNPDRLEEYIKDELLEIQQKNETISENVKKTIGFFAESIVLFPEPPFPEDWSFSETENPIKKKLLGGNFLKPEPGSFNVIISQECKNDTVEELYDQRSKDLISSLTSIAKKIEEICSKINGPSNRFVVYRIVAKKEGGFLGIFQKEKEYQEFDHINYKKTLGLGSFLTFKDFLDKVLDKSITSTFFIQNLDAHVYDLIKEIGQYEENQNELETLCQETKERLKHLEFLDKVCDQTILTKLEDFRIVFENTKKVLEEAQQKGIKDYKLDENDKRKEYFDEAIKTLGKYAANFHDIPLTESISLAHFCLGNLFYEDKNEKSYIDGLEEALTSIRQIPGESNEKSYVLVNKICFAYSPILENSKIKDDSSIMKRIFNINDNNFTIMLKDLLNLIVGFLNNNKNEIEYLQKILDIITAQRRLKEIQTLDHFNVLKEELTVIYQKIDGSILCESFIKLHEYIYKVCQHYGKFGPDQTKATLQKWVKEILDHNIESIFFQKIQKFSIEQLRNNNSDINQFSTFIDITKREDISHNAKKLHEDPEVLKVRIAAYESRGDLYHMQSKFDEAFDSYLLALNLDNNLVKSLRQIDDIYFKKNEILDFNKIPIPVRKLIQEYNLSQFIYILKSKFILLLSDYKSNTKKLFKGYLDKNEFAKIHYIQNLKKVFQILEIIEKERKYDILEEVDSIFRSDVRFEVFNKEKDQIEKSICELNSNTAYDLMRVDIIKSQYNYLNQISNFDAEYMKKCFEETPGKLFFGNKEENQVLLGNKIADFELEDSSSIDYYEQIIELSDEYKKNRKIINLTSKCLFKIGTIRKDLSRYEKAIELDKEFKSISIDNYANKKYYATNSIIRQAYDNMARIYMEKDDLDKALEYFELRGNHKEIKKLLKIIEDRVENEEFFFEKVGDYYSSIGMIDSAVDYYKNTMSMIYDNIHIGVLMNKIGKALSSVGKEGYLTLDHFQKEALLKENLDLANSGEKHFQNVKFKLK